MTDFYAVIQHAFERGSFDEIVRTVCSCKSGEVRGTDSEQDQHVTEQTDEKNAAALNEVCGELVALFGMSINEEVPSTDPERLQCVKTCIEHIAKECNPKLVYLALLEQLNSFKDTFKLTTLLPSCDIVLSRLRPAKSAHLVELITQLDAHLAQTQGDRHELLCVINVCLDALNGFILREYSRLRESMTVSETDWQTASSKPVATLRNAVVRMLLKMLERTAKYRKASSAESVVADSAIVSCAVRYYPNLHDLIVQFTRNVKRSAAKKQTVQPNSYSDEFGAELGDQSDQSETETSTLWSLAHVAYLVHAQNVCLASYPSVFDTRFILRVTLPLAGALLGEQRVETMQVALLGDRQLAEEQNENEADDEQRSETAKRNCEVQKGVQLASAIIGRIDSESLTAEFVSARKQYKFAAALQRVATFNERQAIRRDAMRCYRVFFNKLDANSRLRFVESQLHTLEHDDLLGYHITLFKDELFRFIKLRRSHDAGALCVDAVAAGIAFGQGDFQRIFASLLDRLDSTRLRDPLAWKSTLLAVLNAVWFMFTVDHRSLNESGMWHLERSIRAFVDQLSIAVGVRKAQLRSAVHEAQADSESQASAGCECEAEAHLFAIDLVESAIARAHQVLDAR